MAAAQQHLRPMASARTEMVVRRGRQKKGKRQRVTAEIRSCPLRLTYDTHVRLLEVEGIRTLLALAWVAAGFLYELGVTLEWEEVRLLARLGGWAERKDNPPGKIVLTRGLRRFMDMLTTQAFPDHYREEHGPLPPCIAAWIGDSPPDDL